MVKKHFSNIYRLVELNKKWTAFNSVIQFIELNWTERSQYFERWTLNKKIGGKYSVQFTVHKGSQNVRNTSKKGENNILKTQYFLFIYRRKQDILCELNWVFERNFERSKKMNGELMNEVRTFWTVNWWTELFSWTATSLNIYIYIYGANDPFWPFSDPLHGYRGLHARPRPVSEYYINWLPKKNPRIYF